MSVVTLLARSRSIQGYAHIMHVKWYVKNPPSEGGRDGTSLNVGSDIVGKKLKHSGLRPHNAREVVRENPPSEGGRDGTSLNVGNDIVGKKPKHSGLGIHNAREMVCENSLGEVFELHNSLPDVVQDMSSRIERATIDRNYGDPTVPAFRRLKVSLRKHPPASGVNC